MSKLTKSGRDTEVNHKQSNDLLGLVPVHGQDLVLKVGGVLRRIGLDVLDEANSP